MGECQGGVEWLWSIEASVLGVNQVEFEWSSAWVTEERLFILCEGLYILLSMVAAFLFKSLPSAYLKNSTHLP